MKRCIEDMIYAIRRSGPPIRPCPGLHIQVAGRAINHDKTQGENAHRNASTGRSGAVECTIAPILFEWNGSEWVNNAST